MEGLRPFFADAGIMQSQLMSVERVAPTDLRSWFFEEPGPAWFAHAFRVCMMAVTPEEDRASHEMWLRCGALSGAAARRGMWAGSRCVFAAARGVYGDLRCPLYHFCL